MKKLLSQVLLASLLSSCIPMVALADEGTPLPVNQPTVPQSATVGLVPAFPGAEGGGKYTSGGRGGEVYEVTTLADSGPGSLREAVSGSNRTVVFKVGGTIHLQSPLKITGSNLTIAGQTAPGDGITVADYTTSFAADNVIVRYMRFRLGDRYPSEDDAFGGRNYKNIIIDHCSFSWSVDEVMSMYDNTNTTVQWSIISESMLMTSHWKGRHGYGGIWGGVNTTFHHNLIAHNVSRNPRFPTQKDEDTMEFYNNVIYNWGFMSAYGGGKGTYNIMNNYYKAGPNTYSNVKNMIFGDVDARARMFIDGNYVEGYPIETADNWKGVWSVGGPESKLSSRADFPIPGTPEAAVEAYTAVIANAGANLPKRDSVDARVVQDVRNRTGYHINSPKEVGGFPYMEPTTAVEPDDDHDGMPNSWEQQHRLNPQDPTDRNQLTTEGYTQLEVYLNSIVGNGSLSPLAIVTGPAVNRIYQEGDTVTITADASDPDGRVVKVDFFRNDELLGTVTEAPYQYSWEDATDGTHFLTVRATDETGTSTHSTAVAVHVNKPGSTEPWQAADIGNPGITGHTQVDPDTGSITVKSAGEMGGRADNVHYSYQTLRGNGELVTRLDWVTPTDDGAEAGIMIRKDLSSGSPMAALVIPYVKEGRKAVLMSRASQGALARTIEPDWFTTVPQWMKLVRLGDQFTGLISSDGTTWRKIGSVQLSMPEQIYIGLTANAAKVDDEIMKYNASVFTQASIAQLSEYYPVAPAGVKVLPGDKQITLSWTAVPHADSYMVKRSEIPGGPYTIIGEELKEPAYTDMGLNVGKNYYYVVQTVNSYGVSFDSDEISGAAEGEPEVIYIMSDKFDELEPGLLPEGYVSALESADHKVSVEVVPAESVGNGSTHALRIYDNAPGNAQFTRKFSPQRSSFVVELDYMTPALPGTSIVLQLQDEAGSRTPLSIELRRPTHPTAETNYTFTYKRSGADYKLTDMPENNRWYNLKLAVNNGAQTADLYIDDVLAAEDVPFQADTRTTGIARILARTPGTGKGTMYYDNIQVYIEPVETPKGLQAVPGNGSVLLNWQEAEGAASYTLKRRVFGEEAFIAVASGMTSTQYIDLTVLNGRTYEYVVTAVGPTGESASSNMVTVTPTEKAEKPAAPQGLAAVSRHTQIDLYWNPVENASYYTVKRSLNPEGPYDVVAVKVLNTFYRDGGLVNGSDYYYVLTASSVGGEGEPSHVLQAAPVGALPSPIVKGRAGAGQVYLNWLPVEGAERYIVKRSDTYNGPYDVVAEVTALEEYVDLGLQNGKVYYYRVAAANSTAFSLDAPIVVYVPYDDAAQPAAPSFLKTVPENSRVVLTWEEVPGAVSYAVKRSDTLEGPFHIIAQGLSGTQYTDEGLHNGRTYYYVVTAVSQLGESEASPVAEEIPAPVITVALDGSGDYTTVAAAIAAVPDQSPIPTIIKVRNGVYREKVTVPASKVRIRMIGESSDQTILIYNDHAKTIGPDGLELGTSRSASITINANDFQAENLTIANDAGRVGQAVALYTRGDRMVFRNVRLLGNQDTYYANAGTQYFVDSYIEGTVDYIFGAAAVFFENCVIHSLSNGYVTAASTPESQPGFVFYNSRLTGDPGLKGVVDLGRPWRPHSQVTVLNSYLGEHIKPTGWDNWGNTANETTARYSEFANYGPGSATAARYTWSKQLTEQEAKEVTVVATVGGAAGWNPVSGRLLLGRVQQEAAIVGIEDPDPDTEAPVWTEGSSLTIHPLGKKEVQLSWTPADDPSGIRMYRIYQDGVLVDEVTGEKLSLTIGGLKYNKTYSFEVQAVDVHGNETKNGLVATIHIKSDMKEEKDKEKNKDMDSMDLSE